MEEHNNSEILSNYCVFLVFEVHTSKNEQWEDLRAH